MELVKKCDEFFLRSKEGFVTSFRILSFLKAFCKANASYADNLAALSKNIHWSDRDLSISKSEVVGVFVQSIASFAETQTEVTEKIGGSSIVNLEVKLNKLRFQFKALYKEHKRQMTQVHDCHIKLQKLFDVAMVCWNGLHNKHVSQHTNGESKLARMKQLSSILRSNTTVEEKRQKCIVAFDAYEKQLSLFNATLATYFDETFLNMYNELRRNDISRSTLLNNTVEDMASLQGCLATSLTDFKQTVQEYLSQCGERINKHGEAYTVVDMLGRSNDRVIEYALPCSCDELNDANWKNQLTLAADSFTSVNKEEAKARDEIMARRTKQDEQTEQLQKFAQNIKFGITLESHECKDSIIIPKNQCVQLIENFSPVKNYTPKEFYQIRQVDDSGMLTHQLYFLPRNKCKNLRVNPNMTLRHFIQYTRGEHHFLQFLTEEHNEENLLFWNEVRLYRNLFQNNNDFSFEQQKQMAQSLFKRYISDDAPMQINVDYKMISAVKGFFEKLSTMSPEEQKAVFFEELFTPCHEEIFKLLESDPFSRFKRSSYFRDFFDDARSLKL